MARRQALAVLFVVCLLANAFAAPTDIVNPKRGIRSNEIDTTSIYRSFDKNSQLTANSENVRQTRQNDDKFSAASKSSEDKFPKLNTPEPVNDDDDDDFDEPMDTSASKPAGSSIFSLLNLVSALFPGSSSANVIIRNMIREFLTRNQASFQFARRQFIGDNEIDIDYTADLKPLFQRQESDQSDSSKSDSSENDNQAKPTENDNDNAEEESDEDENDADDDDNNKNDTGEDSDSNTASNNNGNGESDSDEDDSDEPPGGGDGQGGGILGLLAGLSGGEDGQSDLGSLLAAVGGIVANLSGDGVDINSLIASGLGLFVGLLSEGEENPGAVIGSYLLTSLDTLSGGGSKNNGAFFGSFISKLVKGTSAAGDPNASSEENGNGVKMTDSAGFFVSLLMSLLGDMSKGSSGGSSHPWKRDIH